VQTYRNDSTQSHGQDHVRKIEKEQNGETERIGKNEIKGAAGTNRVERNVSSNIVGDLRYDCLTSRLGDARGRSRSPSNRNSPSVRQRSPPREPRSARSRERERDRGKDRDRDRDKERDRERERGVKDHNKVNGSSRKSPPPESKVKSNGESKRKDIEMTNGIDDEDEEQAMQRLIGFSKFRSTKNTKVPGNDKNYGIRKEKKTEYRQYMNRVGGFNRPLSPG
jgi:U4/U6.U5 tri-snRNP-associated protein 3